MFLAKSGFGGTEYLLSGLVSEGQKRGLSDPAIARLSSWNPAQRFGLGTKGSIGEGFDADIALVDPHSPWTIRAADSESAQEYSAFEGIELSARVTDVFLRGTRILEDSRVVGTPTGRYVRRPTTRFADSTRPAGAGGDTGG